MLRQITMAVILGSALALGLSGCRDFEGVDYLDLGHPADPSAEAGKSMPMSGALIPENISPRPNLDGVEPAKPNDADNTMTSRGQRKPTSGAAPKMDHKKMDHSGHRGSH